MWKKYWTQSGDSWVEDDDSTSTSSSSNYTVTATQAMQQYQQIQQQYQWMQTQGIGQTPVGITSTSNPWIMSPKPVYPYAIDEEFILIEWARKRGDRYAEELAQRIAMWDSIKMMKQIQDTGGPYLDSYSSDQLKQWTYKYYSGGTTSTGANTAAPATSSTITVGGIPIQWDKYNPDVT